MARLYSWGARGHHKGQKQYVDVAFHRGKDNQNPSKRLGESIFCGFAPYTATERLPKNGQRHTFFLISAHFLRGFFGHLPKNNRRNTEETHYLVKRKDLSLHLGAPCFYCRLLQNFLSIHSFYILLSISTSGN